MAVFDLDDVIHCAAELVDDDDVEVSDEYRRGVVELAARICLWTDHIEFDHAVTVMGYAVCGVNRPPRTGGSP